MKLDAYDHRILAALQRDGRLSNVQLAVARREIWRGFAQ